MRELLRLQKLTEHIVREVALVQGTAKHLFALTREQIADGIQNDRVISEQVEAFV